MKGIDGVDVIAARGGRHTKIRERFRHGARRERTMPLSKEIQAVSAQIEPRCARRGVSFGDVLHSPEVKRPVLKVLEGALHDPTNAVLVHVVHGECKDTMLPQEQTLSFINIP